MNTNDIADLVAAVEYALNEAEHYTDPNTGRPCVRLVRLDDDTGLFAWLEKKDKKSFFPMLTHNRLCVNLLSIKRAMGLARQTGESK